MSDWQADVLRRYADRFGRDLGAVRSRLLTGDKTPPTQIATDNGLPAAAGSGPAAFFADFTAPHGPRHVRVCGAAACTAASGGTHLGEVATALGTPVDTCREDGAVSVQEVRCLGYCYAGPAALDGETACVGRDIGAQLNGTRPRQDPPITVQADCPEPVVTAGLLAGDSPWSVWPQVIARSDPADVLAEVDVARLRGRGGAGFPAARKWAAARRYPRPRVVVANGDEGDPGSYVDRLLMERDPDRVLEGLALAAFAVEAEQAVIFIRAEYPRAHQRMRAAVRQAYRDGHFGRNLHGSSYTLEVLVESGAGSYVSGEETALLNAIDGLRGVVRPRPPYPVEHGLGGRPTVVNNVETLATVPWIIRHGGAAYARFGTTTTDMVRARTDVLRTMATGSLCAFGRRVPAAVRSVAEVYGLEGWR